MYMVEVNDSCTSVVTYKNVVSSCCFSIQCSIIFTTMDRIRKCQGYLKLSFSFFALSSLCIQSSLDNSAQLIYAKNYPTTFYCIFQWRPGIAVSVTQVFSSLSPVSIGMGSYDHHEKYQGVFPGLL